MVKRTAVLGVMALVAMTTGCANIQDREWDGCALAGAIIGATVGGVTGGVVTNNVDDHPTNEERGGAIGGGIVASAAIGGLLGHVICDPEKAAPAPPPAPAADPPPPPAPGTKLGTVGSTFFDFNKATVKPGSSRAVLDGVVKTMKDNPNMRVSVQGHTDSIGSDAYNQKLSERRANAVKQYLAGEGISGSRIDTEGFGESKPVASNKT